MSQTLPQNTLQAPGNRQGGAVSTVPELVPCSICGEPAPWDPAAPIVRDFSGPDLDRPPIICCSEECYQGLTSPEAIAQVNRDLEAEPLDPDTVVIVVTRKKGAPWIDIVEKPIDQVQEGERILGVAVPRAKKKEILTAGPRKKGLTVAEVKKLHRAAGLGRQEARELVNEISRQGPEASLENYIALADDIRALKRDLTASRRRLILTRAKIREAAAALLELGAALEEHIGEMFTDPDQEEGQDVT